MRFSPLFSILTALYFIGNGLIYLGVAMASPMWADIIAGMSVLLYAFILVLTYDERPNRTSLKNYPQ